MITEQTVKVGIVGAGFGRYGLLPAFRLDPRCEVVALCSRTEEKCRAYADALAISSAWTSVEAMLEQCPLDAVAFAIPPAIQFELAALALRSGKHVLCEKPLALNTDQAAQLCILAEQAQLANMVDFLFPEIEEWQTACSIVQQGKLGPIRTCVVNWLFQSYDHNRRISTWKTDGQRGGGVLSHFASHTLYYLEHIVGRAVSLAATMSCSGNRVGNGESYLDLSLEFDSGARASAVICSNALCGSGHRLEFYGDDGTLVLQSPQATRMDQFRLSLARKGDTALHSLPAKRSGRTDPALDSRVLPASRITSRFLDWIETGRPQKPDFQDGARVQQLIDLIRESDRCGKRICT